MEYNNKDLEEKTCKEIATTDEGKKWLYGNRCFDCVYRVIRRCNIL